MSFGKGAARVGDSHRCPHGTHQGGALVGGSPDVWIDGRNAARSGDRASCEGPCDALAGGAPGVFINWQSLAREGDGTRHSGVVTGASSGVLVGELGSPGDPFESTEGGRIESDFAWDRVRGVARKLPRSSFAMWAGGTFGYDLSPVTYHKLHDALLDGSFVNPEIVVTPYPASGHPAWYNSRTGKIYVARTTADDATREGDGAWTLLLALIEEFGHHIDRELRTRYASPGDVAPDAPLDEGAAFAFALVDFRFAERDEVTYGVYHPRGGGAGALTVSWKVLKDALTELDQEAMIANDGREGDREFFDAPDHAHVDSALGTEKIMPTHEATFVEVGNWVADHSQFVGALPVEAFAWVFWFVRTAGTFVEPSDPSHQANATVARDYLTRIVKVLASEKFAAVYADPASAQALAIDTAFVGVCHPSHHMDNPLAEEGGEPYVGMGFHPKYDAATHGGILPETWTHRAIEASRGYVKKALEDAVAQGRNPKGLALLGRALHPIEDFYSHSNFIEIVLARRDARISTHTDASKRLASGDAPIVTGWYGSADMVVSLSLKLIVALSKPPAAAGAKPDLADKVVQEFVACIELNHVADLDWYRKVEGAAASLREKVPAWSRARERAHKLLEKIRPVLLKLVPGLTRAREAVRAMIARGLTVLARLLVDQVRAKQIATPTSTGVDPTHSMLAKDDASHALHKLAMDCARRATLTVGKAMVFAWASGRSEGVVKVALDHLRHPFVAGDVPNVAAVQDWHEQHPNLVIAPPNDHLGEMLEQLEAIVSRSLRQGDASSAGARLAPIWAPTRMEEMTPRYFQEMEGIKAGALVRRASQRAQR